MLLASPHYRFALYAGANVAFLLMAGVAYAMGDSLNPRFLYLILLFALCSTPLIDFDGLNGSYALLGIFLPMYFIMYGVGDLGALLQRGVAAQSNSILTATECVILVGGALLVLGYRLVVSSTRSMGAGAVRMDWPVRAIVLVGVAMWAIGTYAYYDWYVHIIVAQTNEATRKGLQSRSTYALSAYILAQMMQPLGILLIAYAWRRYRLHLLLVVVLMTVVLQVVLGFVADVKGLAMHGGILVIVTCVLIDGRIPKVWLVGAVAYVMIVFPIFQAYRAEVSHGRGTARTEVVQNLGKTIALAISVKDRVYKGPDRAQTFLERLSLNGSVELIVEKTGSEVPFQHGYTLTPLLGTFIPKIIWSDKPDVVPGQVMNREFHVGDSDDLIVSPSHLGELYWNFGWAGVVFGMSLIGAVLGFVGSRFNLAEAKTVTRLLVTVVTIKGLILTFEGPIAPIYVVWLRSLAGIALLHLVFARVPVTAGWFLPEKARRSPEPDAPGVAATRLYPNLMS